MAILVDFSWQPLRCSNSWTACSVASLWPCGSQERVEPFHDSCGCSCLAPVESCANCPWSCVASFTVVTATSAAVVAWSGVTALSAWMSTLFEVHFTFSSSRSAAGLRSVFGELPAGCCFQCALSCQELEVDRCVQRTLVQRRSGTAQPCRKGPLNCSGHCSFIPSWVNGMPKEIKYLILSDAFVYYAQSLFD